LDRVAVMRLDRGPTASFKDFAARMMARLIGRFVRETGRPLTILVATSGAVGFVGLVIPHVVRPFTGARYAKLLPVAMLVGGIFLIWVDTTARTIFEPQELPVGVLTALIGAPFFAYQIHRQGQIKP
ncbi:MAG: iron chelate uptake ABC transporter family permease subunit, partial [Acidimicrobiales bacterium]|nr:iron chelate uptake ABC transporter family permease subunit [Acidimicrobiales bacterium]